MNSSTFLLEIGTEDLPARFLSPSIMQLRENSESILRENRIKISDIHTYGTPRRLVLLVEGLPLMQDDRIKEVFGPISGIPTTFLIDENGKIVDKYIGFHSEKKFEMEILKLLKRLTV